MMGSSSGLYKGGGGSLSSSSNLSPLAPPFMVDKSSFTRSNSTNPSVNFTELPVYGTVFDPAGPFSSTGHKFAATEIMTTASPSYGYPASPSSNSEVYYLGQQHNAGGGTGYDPFSYEPFPNPGPGDGYGPFVSSPPTPPPPPPPPPRKEGYLGVNYDLLSSSGGFGATQVEHHGQGGSSVGEYKPNWNGFWGGLGNGSEPTRWAVFGPGPSGVNLKEFNLGEGSSNMSRVSVDGSGSHQSHHHPAFDIVAEPKSFHFGDSNGKGHPFVDVGSKSNPKLGVCVSQGLDAHGEGPAALENSFDIFGGKYHFGMHQPDQNVPFKNVGSSSSDPSRMPGFVSVAASAEAPGLPRPLFEPITSFSHFPKMTMNPTNTQSVGTTEMASSNLSSGYDSFYQKDPQNALGQPKVVIRRPLSTSSKFGSSTEKGETANDGLDVKFVSVETKFTNGVVPQFSSSSNGFASKTDYAEASSCAAEKHSSGSDLHNPAEDSPCWKGASSSRFSPFSASDDVPAETTVMSQEDACKSLNPEKNNPPLDASDSVDISSEKASEGPGNQKSYCIDLNIPDGLEFLDDRHASKKDLGIWRNPRNGLDSKLPLAPELLLKEAQVFSALNASEANTPEAAQKSSGRSSCSAPGDKASLLHSQSIKKGPEQPGFDVDLVLKTLMKQSDMFHSYCLGNPEALTEQHCGAVERIINNLNASLSKMGQQQTTVLPSEDNHSLRELPVSEMVNDAEVVAAVDEQAKKAEDFLDSIKDDMDALQANNMTQAIKKILCDNLDEGIDQPELVYRNLWLEAEAALCVMTAKSRFHRMKTDMEGSSHDRMKDQGLTPGGHDSPSCDDKSQKSNANTQCKDTEEIPAVNSTKFSTGKELRTDHIFPPFMYDSGPFIFGKESSGGIKFENNSVMARYQILKSRGDGENSETLIDNDNNKGKQPSCSNDVEAPLMARYQILASREENCDDLSSKEEATNVVQTNGVVESPVMARYQILKCRMNTTDSLYEGPSPDENHQLNPKLLNSISSIDDDRDCDHDLAGSVMSRFRILQNRVNGVNTPSEPPKDVTGVQQRTSFMATNVFGPYPEISMGEDGAHKLDGDGEPLMMPYNVKKLGTEILEGWYGNDSGTSSDWEHVSKEELRRQN